MEGQCMLTAIFKRSSYEEGEDNVAQVALGARHGSDLVVTWSSRSALLAFKCCLGYVLASAWLRLGWMSRYSRARLLDACSGIRGALG